MRMYQNWRVARTVAPHGVYRRLFWFLDLPPGLVKRPDTFSLVKKMASRSREQNIVLCNTIKVRIDVKFFFDGGGR